MVKVSWGKPFRKFCSLKLHWCLTEEEKGKDDVGNDHLLLDSFMGVGLWWFFFFFEITTCVFGFLALLAIKHFPNIIFSSEILYKLKPDEGSWLAVRLNANSFCLYSNIGFIFCAVK